MKISIGSDHGGCSLAGEIVWRLSLSRCDVISHIPAAGTGQVDYPDYAFAVAADIVNGLTECGILVCRSGLGMAVAANKCRGIRATPCWSPELAIAARGHGDANVLCLGADYLDRRTALAIVDAFLRTKFLGGKHGLRLEKIYNYEKKHYHGA
jgi:ribose 5-phosphate isomerase B